MALPHRRETQSDQDWHRHYQIENPDEVEAYVAEHPSVTAILNEAPAEIHAVFSNGVPPRLQLEWSPEDGDCWLFIGIPSADLGPSVLPRIYELEERWWLDRMTTTDATVVFDVVRQ
jgi:hypothetical protein